MDIQVKSVLKSNYCYMAFSHNFNSMRKAKEYTKNLKDSVKNSDTTVESTLYINTKK